MASILLLQNQTIFDNGFQLSDIYREFTQFQTVLEQLFYLEVLDSN